ncbi:MAG: phosphoribosylamine--glycine ligase [Chloroflexota bacterium]|nr:phosphoribosylamine--glycine ligase [Chloroflexota bacterium]MDE3193911.1 phosphoribosylamine--glycine ligase [Chloroflexota bacterium]
MLGGGGREYAIAWALARADSVGTIDVMPGNAAMSVFARLVDIPPTDVARVEQHLAAARIDLGIVGPDELVAAGLGDVLRRAGVAAVGPSREAGRIEWSKSFAKELMDEAGVPTASWKSYPDAASAAKALEERDGPVVVKADGLAAGKGVVVARTRQEALDALGSPTIRQGTIVLEEALEGEEASLQALVDGETVVALPPARDHKRFGEGDTGPNTGGMGACSPTRILPDDEAQDVADAVIAPVAKRLVARAIPYRGVIYAGLMRTRDGWKVIEYNSRFGDPEAQVTLPRLEGDLGKLLLALGEGRLAAYARETPLRFSPRAFVSVALCAAGYPGKPETGDAIEGLDALPEGAWAFHAATKQAGGRFVTAGGRVVHVVAGGSTVAEARELAYRAAEKVKWKGITYRSDIARREV